MSFDRALASGKLLRVSSEDKVPGGTNSDFIVQLGNTSYVQAVRGVELISVSFKHVFPNVFDSGGASGTGNSIFTFNYNGVLLTAAVPAAWYTAAQYATALTSAINANLAVLNPVTVTLVPFNGSSSLHFVITASGGDMIGLVSKADGNAAADLVGINATTAPATVSTAQTTPDFGGLSNVYLSSGVLAGNNCAASSQGGEQIPVIMGIPLDVDYGAEVYYKVRDVRAATIVFSSERSINFVDLAIRTRSGDYLDLLQNNLTVEFKLIHQSAFPRD